MGKCRDAADDFPLSGHVLKAEQLTGGGGGEARGPARRRRPVRLVPAGRAGGRGHPGRCSAVLAEAGAL